MCRSHEIFVARPLDAASVRMASWPLSPRDGASALPSGAPRLRDKDFW